MRALHAATGETINLAERHDLASVTIHEIPSAHQVRYTTRVGAASPLHLGASSRATLAFSAAAVRDATLATPLVRVTENSIVDRAVLERTLDCVRGDGFATSFGERVQGTNSIACRCSRPTATRSVARDPLAVARRSRGPHPQADVAGIAARPRPRGARHALNAAMKKGGDGLPSIIFRRSSLDRNAGILLGRGLA